jgi:CheY-like chemotaxis protein/HPt (histidine-containing phosphotransfer) domain-containing protein
VIDLNMPGMDGIELARALKADPVTSGIVLFLLSSSGHHLEPARSHLTGFAASLTKPVRASELFDCLITSLHGGTEQEPAAAPAAAAGTPDILGSILLVEDNQVNQLVGSKVLTKLGYTFEIANNGLEAVEAVRTAAYDAILMDCQMPEMDGYQATSAIREFEGLERHTPIIAMTAAAMEGDRQACLAAGMDDFISKPVRLEAVSEVLQRWAVARTAGSSEPTSAGTKTAPSPEPVDGSGSDRAGSDRAGSDRAGSDRAGSDPLDRTQIELLLSLDGGEGETLGEIVEQYLTHGEKGLHELRRVLSAGDVESLERAAHTLKGASANVGASAMVELCAALETTARAKELSEANGLMERADREFARVQDALQLLTAGS